MAIITASLLNSLRTGFRKNFQDGLDGVEPQYTQIATVIKSTTASNTYGWLGQWPGFREWIGDRVHNSMKESSYQILNKDFESSVNVQRNHIEDDELGVYTPMFQEAGRATKMFADELMFPMLALGESSLCYDGQNFFDTDHPVNDKVDGTGTDVSVSNMIVDVAYTGDTWYVMCTNRSLKPLIYQERKAPQFVAMTKMDDEAVYTSKEYRYGIDLRCNAGFGFWQMAIAMKCEMTPERIWEAITLMKSYTADGGRKLGLRPNLIVAPSSKEKLATRILERDTFDEGGVSVSNELKGKISLLIAEQL